MVERLMQEEVGTPWRSDLHTVMGCYHVAHAVLNEKISQLDVIQ